LLHLNTFGGELEAADQIRTLLLKCEIPVWVYIDNNAASAGALISIACDSIYMNEGASIGAASVVDQQGNVLPDKYQSYMRSLMRTTAETNGRNPDIAQAMVDPDIHIDGIIDSGKVLTFTTTEAMKYQFCEGECHSVEEVISAAHISNYTLVEQELTWIERVILFLINPVISSLLIMAIMFFDGVVQNIPLTLLLAVIGPCVIGLTGIMKKRKPKFQYSKRHFR
jgi:membrane-bound serine protease (ClpP class)